MPGPTLWDVIQDGNIDKNRKDTQETFGAMKEPTGFVDASESDISFVDGSREFTIEPVGASFEYRIHGVSYVKTTAQTKVISTAVGIHFLYFDGETLSETTAFTPAMYSDYAFVAYVYWDGTNAIVFADERHGCIMDGKAHEYLHNTVGTRYNSGLSAGDYTIAGDGSADAHAELSVGDGVIYDEDIKIQITDGSPQTLALPAQIPVYYRSGAGADNWMKKTADNFPVLQGVGTITYNLDTAGTWSMPDVTDTQFMAMWVFATNDVNNPVVAILGQRMDALLADAQDNNKYESLTFGNLPFREMKVLFRLIFLADSGFGNSPKCALRAIQDLRSVSNLPSGTYVASAHSSLTGLNDANSHPGTAIGNVPAGTIASTDVQGAINELDSEKVAKSGALTQLTSRNHADLQNFDASDDHTQYLKLAGRAGGQTIIGGTVNSNNLILQSNTTGLTRGVVNIYDILRVYPNPSTLGSGYLQFQMRTDAGFIGGHIEANSGSLFLDDAFVYMKRDTPAFVMWNTSSALSSTSRVRFLTEHAADNTEQIHLVYQKDTIGDAGGSYFSIRGYQGGTIDTPTNYLDYIKFVGSPTYPNRDIRIFESASGLTVGRIVIFSSTIIAASNTLQFGTGSANIVITRDIINNGSPLKYTTAPNFAGVDTNSIPTIGFIASIYLPLAGGTMVGNIAMDDTGGAKTVDTIDVSAHKHDGTAGNGVKIAYADLSGVPGTFAPTAHQLDGADHTVSGLTAGDVLKALTPTTFGFATPGFLPLAGGSMTGPITLAQGAVFHNLKETAVVAVRTIDTYADTAGLGCVWHYVVKDGVNLRSGTILAAWDATDVSAPAIRYTEVSTNDVGDTSPLVFSVDMNANNVRLLATPASGSWEIRVVRLMM